MDEILRKFNFDNNIAINGLTSELSFFYIASKFKKESKSLIVLTSTLYEANKIYQCLSVYTDKVLLFPMDDFFMSVAVAVSPDLKNKRLETLRSLKEGNWIIITNLTGYLRYLPAKEEFNNKLIFKNGQNFSKKDILNVLEKYGYQRESLVTKTGEYAERGFIIDVFLLHEDHPCRLELYGNTIESIRYFDENTQKSLKTISEIELIPYVELETESHSSLLNYVLDATVIYYNYNQVMASYQKLAEEIVEYSKEKNVTTSLMFEFEEVKPLNYIYLNSFNDKVEGIKNVSYESKETPNFNLNFETLKNYVYKMRRDKYQVYFFLSTDSEVKKIKDLLDVDVNYINKKINKGFIIDNLVVISEYDIDKKIENKIVYNNTYRMGKKLKTFDDIKKGDYVVHTVHGIGIYMGVISLRKNNMIKDYIEIDYKDNDKVYIPVEKIETIYKYSSKEGDHPKVNKLGTTAWQKTKAFVRKKISDITEELIKLYSERAKTTGPTFKSYPEEAIFSSKFQYEETPDQMKAIADVLEDLKIDKPMDRLLCGDVGFGKTEVAFRAAFNTIINGYQVAYLCPTTILSKQHYETASKRFDSLAINIKLINRFTSSLEAKQILLDLKDGKIDMLIGTHRLLSKDIEFKNLGLLIVDEEQRFGVTHKEKIKEMKQNVNVLTLSATPIPRTLKFALSGLRDLSIIDTPPVNRYPIQTYVIAESDYIVREAIYKELSREGQIYIVYNNIAHLEEKLNFLKTLVPEANIKFAHGQMSKTELENIMEDFVNNRFDVLLCTTIIETGIDIPNVNTLIIYNADLFGLSQLYQIRGRVGRSDKIAFAYLMYNKTKVLNDIAVKRLQSIKEFTELGSGYKIAMRDLAIRGAGDLLGSEQAGYLDAVGIDLYMKMVEDAVSGKEEEVDNESSLLNVETHIDNEYVSDENVKIEIHKMINEINSYKDLIKVKRELEDRFGKVNESIEIYMQEELFESMAEKLHIQKVEQNDRYILIEFSEKLSNKLPGDKLFLTANNISNNFKLQYRNKRIQVLLFLNDLNKHYIYYLNKLLEAIISF